MRKKIIISIFIILLALFSSVVESIEFNSESNDLQRTNEDKPDLVVTRIHYYSHDIPVPIATECEIKNKGNASASGKIIVHLMVFRVLFGIIPIKMTYNEIKTIDDDNFSPGETKHITFYYLPETGLRFYRFTAEVDYFEDIEESNEKNNDLSKIFFIIDPESMFGWWG